MRTKPQKSGASAIGKKTEVSNANEARRKQVEQEAAQKLIHRKGHRSLSIAVRGVPPTEGDVVVGQREESMVGDGNSMCIAAEVAQNMLGTAEGPFTVDDPIVAVELPDERMESLRFREELELSVEAEFALSKGAL